MTVADSIIEMISSLDDIFETNQEKVIEYILRAENVIFLDTCFITKSYYLQTEKVLQAFEHITGGREKQKAVFAVTELVLYELKDSSANALQAKNKIFFEKMSEYGFCLLLLKEECIYENIKLFLNYPYKKWNEIFSVFIHDNVANLSFNRLIRTDRRMPYYGFSEIGYNVPNDKNFIRDIIWYLKNVKTNKDSMAEELVCTSLFPIFELTYGSEYNKYIFCSHDFGAIARINKVVQTSYPNIHKQFKTINLFGFVQFMVTTQIITSKDEAVKSLKQIMGKDVSLIIYDDLPFTPIEKTMMIEDAVENLFDGKYIALAGRKM